MVGTAQFDFTGETAIVTGSTKGIGRGIAAELAGSGANVVVNSRSPDDVATVAAELEAQHPGSVIGITADVGDPEQIDRLVAAARDEFGSIDILVNNAAVWPPNPIDEQGLDEWDLGLDVNARGPYYASLLVAEDMRESGSGSIVNVTSKAGERHGGGHGLYGVSKATQTALTWRLAYELGDHGIRVNAVSTAQTDSYQLRKSTFDRQPSAVSEEEVQAAMAEKGADIPLGRVGQPADIADGVMFLASDAASYVTGHVLRVSGGNNLQ
jgi:NAD(P)-dependent dehydrogenase (short-subunit alcohol dehydrogenase family)